MLKSEGSRRSRYKPKHYWYKPEYHPLRRAGLCTIHELVVVTRDFHEPPPHCAVQNTLRVLVPKDGVLATFGISLWHSTDPHRGFYLIRANLTTLEEGMERGETLITERWLPRKVEIKYERTPYRWKM